MTPAVRTVLSRVEAARAIRDACARVFGVVPAGETLAILVAQSALETGHWRSMWCWNFGNIRGSFQGAWTSFRAGEIVDGREIFLDAGPTNKFRAYASAGAGAEDFVRFLGTATRPGQTNRYAAAWAAALRGDALTYALELGRAGYYTANREKYAATVRTLVDVMRATCVGVVTGDALDAESSADERAAWRESPELRDAIAAMGDDPAVYADDDIEPVYADDDTGTHPALLALENAALEDEEIGEAEERAVAEGRKDLRSERDA
jgi:hypothetical protein